MGRPTKTALALWADLWASPHAVAWEDLGWTRVVARYCKLLLAAERPKAPGSLLGEVRQLEDRLGLTPMAMRRLQWEVGQRQTGPAEGDPPAEVSRLDDYRGRYTAG